LVVVVESVSPQWFRQYKRARMSLKHAINYESIYLKIK
jgi:hypothetical protein